MKIKYSRTELIIWSILFVTYILSYAGLIASYFFPYYQINGNQYFRYENFEIFPFYYIIVSIIAMVANWLMFYRVNSQHITRSDLLSLIPLNLFLLSERLWHPYVNPDINTTPDITIGLLLFHTCISIQWIGVYLYKLKRQNDKLMFI